MRDTTSDEQLAVLEPIDEIRSHRQMGTRRKRSGSLTKAEQQTALWFHPPVTSSIVSTDDSTSACSDLLDDSNSAYGSAYTVEMLAAPALTATKSNTEGEQGQGRKRSSSRKKLICRQSSEKDFLKLAKLQNPKKSVRFATDQDDNVECQVHRYKKVRESSHHKIWWTDEELTSFRMSCISTVNEYKEKGEFLWAIATLYSTTAEGSELLKALDLFHANYHARGLEMHIAGNSNATMQKHQRTVLRKVRDPKELRRKSKAVTKTSMAFAVRAAQADQQEASSSCS